MKTLLGYLTALATAAYCLFTLNKERELAERKRTMLLRQRATISDN